jgi:hypothetical protein
MLRINIYQYDDDDVLNEHCIRYRMIRSHRSAVTVAVGAGCHRCRSPDTKKGKEGKIFDLGCDNLELLTWNGIGIKNRQKYRIYQGGRSVVNVKMRVTEVGAALNLEDPAPPNFLIKQTQQVTSNELAITMSRSIFSRALSLTAARQSLTRAMSSAPSGNFKAIIM